MSLDRCPWYIAGALLGLLIVGLRAVLNKPFGALGGYVELAESARQPRQLGFRAFLLIGLVVGGALYAAVAGSPSVAFVYESRASVLSAVSLAQLASLCAAGVVMGFGARTAGGCTSGHGLSGMSLGSPASIVSSMTFFATAVALAHASLWFGGAR
jgi:uncharacterized membrane protein YedE/YeeE